MHSPIESSNDSNSLQNQNTKLQPLTVEMIRALTPLFIALIGGVIGLTVLLIGAKDTQSAFGLASTAIAGAAGLAQPNKDPEQKDR
jgi:hypothetical protein